MAEICHIFVVIWDKLWDMYEKRSEKLTMKENQKNGKRNTKTTKKAVSKTTKDNYSKTKKGNYNKTTIGNCNKTTIGNCNKVTKDKRTSAAKINDNRVCVFSGECTGCKYIELPYEKQLDMKRKQIEKLLGGFGKIDAIVGMDNPFYYRNKVHAVYYRKKNGQIVPGIYKEGTHDIIPVNDCKIENKKAREIVNTIAELIKSFKVPLYNEDTGFGLLRHVLIRTADVTGEIMVVLVTASPVFPSRKNFANALMKKHKEIITVVHNINDKDTSMILGERTQTITGKGYINDMLCGKRFRLNPTAFYQVNAKMTEKLYNKAIECAALTGKETVIDAYCGIGTIGLAASDKAGEVIGVELNGEAISAARVNAKINGVKNASFYVNDAGKFMTGLAASDKKIDVVFMDPPRSGSSTQFIDAIHQLLPDRVVYISCGPESLKRDLEYFKKKGKYRVVSMSPFDMFCHTSHVETVVLMSRVK